MQTTQGLVSLSWSQDASALTHPLHLCVTDHLKRARWLVVLVKLLKRMRYVLHTVATSILVGCTLDVGKILSACPLVFPACALFILTCTLVFPPCVLVFPACPLIFPACALAFPAYGLFILTCTLGLPHLRAGFPRVCRTCSLSYSPTGQSCQLPCWSRQPIYSACKTIILARILSVCVGFLSYTFTMCVTEILSLSPHQKFLCKSHVGTSLAANKFLTCKKEVLGTVYMINKCKLNDLFNTANALRRKGAQIVHWRVEEWAIHSYSQSNTVCKMWICWQTE